MQGKEGEKMREILFRGKQKDNGEWVYGYYAYCTDGGMLSNRIYSSFAESYGTDKLDVWWFEVIPETVGQYTGLTDKNGTKIFEGDIVEMPAYRGGKHFTTVYFENGKFAVNGSNYHFKDIKPRNLKVIGNITDNPDLLEEIEND